MLSKKKEIKIKIATDKPFRSIYWTPTQEELRQIVVGALKSFEEQFPTVSFILRLKEEVWDSQGYPAMLDVLPYLKIGISNARSFEVMKKVLIQRAKNEGFRKENIIFNEGTWEYIRIRNENKSKESRFHFLWSYLNRLFSEEILFDLKKKISNGDREITLGFTGRFFVAVNPPGRCFGVGGVAERDGSYAVFFPTKDRLAHIILHEVGHLFGAQHIEKEKGPSIMNPAFYGENYFDSVNAKRVNDHIEKL